MEVIIYDEKLSGIKKKNFDNIDNALDFVINNINERNYIYLQIENRTHFIINYKIAKLFNLDKNKIKDYLNIIIDEILFPEIV